MIYYHKSELGCGLGIARDLREAERKVRKDVGSYHAAGGIPVRKATAQDIEWVRQMCGYIPKEAR